ncbi:hypothetical protein PIROE2DRAFT_1732 [Piromyces sp. E2]|nr:hypothetical protein PIROE2DRAFT_1732 [Piromyces sp. E2]|eukprot:OUM70305.1 hypothetical protein PIROE2DRAFT_1732 [Piromyces sp. E2]
MKINKPKNKRTLDTVKPDFEDSPKVVMMVKTLFETLFKKNGDSLPVSAKRK